MVNIFGPGPRPRFSETTQKELAKRLGSQCGGCERKFPLRNLTVDHRRARARNGSDQLRNLQLLCGFCNSVKGDGTTTQLKVRLRKQGILPAKTTAKKTAKGKASTTKKKGSSKSTRSGRRNDWI